MTINETQDEVIEEFLDLDEWLDRYQLLIDLGTEMPALAAEEKTPEHLIDGCQSRVWVSASVGPDGLMRLEADSDAMIVKGIIALLIRVLSGHTPSDILAADLYFIDRIGLSDHLSPTRANGLLAMVKTIRCLAKSHA